jgi:hypothetical protein
MVQQGEEDALHVRHVHVAALGLSVRRPAAALSVPICLRVARVLRPRTP